MVVEHGWLICIFFIFINRFFYSYTLIISSILVQLFIGVILDGFGNVSKSENAQLTPEQYEQFVKIWNGIISLY